MKKLTFLILLVFTSSIVAQTKTETIEWLNQKFAEHKADLDLIQITISNKDSEDELITIMDYFEYSIYGLYFAAKDIKSVKMVQAPNGNYYFKLYSLNNGVLRIRLSSAQKEAFKESDIKEKKWIGEFRLVTSCDYKVAVKIRKALIHLINISGGKILSDDLFDN